jgi:hypothetical protein
MRGEEHKGFRKSQSAVDIKWMQRSEQQQFAVAGIAAKEKTWEISGLK